MLYQTHRPLFFTFTPFTTPIHPPPPTATTAAATTLPSHFLSHPSIQEMECVEGALKSRVRRPEMAVLDDLWAVNGQSGGGVSGDDFFVDDLLDFSKGDTEDGIFEEEAEHEHEKRQAEKDKDFDPTGSNFSGVNDFPAVPCSELSVPADDLADLEWLSHFVEDSFSEYSLAYLAGKLPEKPVKQLSEPPETPAPTVLCFPTPVQTKARSKRARTGGRVWSLGSPSLTESSSLSSSSSSSSSSSTTTSTSSPSNNPWLIYTVPSQTADSLLGPPAAAAKKQKKKKETSGGSGGSQQPRRCSHCLVQKTPQWRAGPLGAKTLCNACGVRYKSGRLLPEYRPACSPTFSSDIHSNNHRKVLEMRQKKDMEARPAPPVQSF